MFGVVGEVGISDHNPRIGLDGVCIVAREDVRPELVEVNQGLNDSLEIKSSFKRRDGNEQGW